MKNDDLEEKILELYNKEEVVNLINNENPDLKLTKDER